MLALIVDALREAGATRIAVIGGDEAAAACRDTVERFIPEGPTGSENVLRALRAWPDDDDEPLVYATSDMPYVTGAAVADFLSRVRDGHIAIALAEYDAFARRFPGAPPSYGITLDGERVVNGGLFSLPAGSCDRLASFATRLFEARKAPWRMASMVSPVMLLRLVMRRLNIAHLEQFALEHAGIPASAVRNCAPELGYDADTAAEYAYARERT
jgi:hypothetical protein